MPPRLIEPSHDDDNDDEYNNDINSYIRANEPTWGHT
jgi:hypothetical protein